MLDDRPEEQQPTGVHDREQVVARDVEVNLLPCAPVGPVGPLAVIVDMGRATTGPAENMQHVNRVIVGRLVRLLVDHAGHLKPRESVELLHVVDVGLLDPVVRELPFA